ERILALPDGRTQWQAMESRQAAGRRLRAVRPYVTWIVLFIITVIFAGQYNLIKEDDLFGNLDLGANASLLTLNGDWFRLVTANLLHANFMHYFNNALFVMVMGALAEQLLGARRFLLLVLVTGILSQLTSALWHHFIPSPSVVFSIGISGILFGILGGL